MRPNKSRDVVQSRSLLSKFLYHSVNEETRRPPSPPRRPVSESPVSMRRVICILFLIVIVGVRKRSVGISVIVKSLM